MTAFIWAGFIIFVLAMLALDLGIVNRKVHVINARRAMAFTAFFVALALCFNVLVYFMYENHWLGIGLTTGENLGGKRAAIQFFTGWLMEYSLSLDNIFIIALIFRHMAVPREQQHRVLFWGIMGALVMRGIMIGIGAALIHKFHWTIYLFGGILLLTAIRMLFTGDEEPEPENAWIMRTARRLLPVAPAVPPTDGAPVPPPVAGDGHMIPPVSGYGDRFFVRLGGKLFVTPLFMVLLVVEFTDVIFAVDSIPAIFGVTTDPFLVFTSNVFAILGLRSLYFALAAIIDKFRYLKTALVFVLLFIAVKMLVPDTVVKIPDEVSLLTIAGILTLGVLASLFVSHRERRLRPAPVDDIADVVEETWRRSRRVIVLVVGLTILASAIPIGLIPGPGGIAVAIGGLALLATEFVWARKIVKNVKERSAAAMTEGIFFKKPKPILIPIVVAIAAVAMWLLLKYEPIHRNQILLASIGPWIAIVFWAVVTVRRYNQLRRKTVASAEAPPPA